jgi:SAM-dependent methyltransferase
MHGLCMPLAWLVSSLQIDPGWFLLAFILLLLVYRGALSGQIPLYLSNPQTVDALETLLANREAPRFLDLGAGVGSTLIPLADRRPDGEFIGVENAPLTWFIGRLLGLGRPHLHLRWGNLWQTPLADVDVVYAFLSPVPMADLWQKIEREMKPGSLFISNSFPVPGVVPSHIVEVDCTPPRPLYCYQR